MDDYVCERTYCSERSSFILSMSLPKSYLSQSPTSLVINLLHLLSLAGSSQYIVDLRQRDVVLVPSLLFSISPSLSYSGLAPFLFIDLYYLARLASLPSFLPIIIRFSVCLLALAPLSALLSRFLVLSIDIPAFSLSSLFLSPSVFCCSGFPSTRRQSTNRKNVEKRRASEQNSRMERLSSVILRLQIFPRPLAFRI